MDSFFKDQIFDIGGKLEALAKDLKKDQNLTKAEVLEFRDRFIYAASVFESINSVMEYEEELARKKRKK